VGPCRGGLPVFWFFFGWRVVLKQPPRPPPPPPGVWCFPRGYFSFPPTQRVIFVVFFPPFMFLGVWCSFRTHKVWGSLSGGLWVFFFWASLSSVSNVVVRPPPFRYSPPHPPFILGWVISRLTPRFCFHSLWVDLWCAAVTLPIWILVSPIDIGDRLFFTPHSFFFVGSELWRVPRGPLFFVYKFPRAPRMGLGSVFPLCPPVGPPHLFLRGLPPFFGLFEFLGFLPLFVSFLGCRFGTCPPPPFVRFFRGSRVLFFFTGGVVPVSMLLFPFGSPVF